MRDDREFTALAEQYMDMVYRVALNAVRCPADAEDVTQNVMTGKNTWISLHWMGAGSFLSQYCCRVFC
ncbi:MAG: sigma-70 family RNA polymerase sigma factor [Firmicutes bacterium]|nr:sigma-70 family RNA polymerase sigma factor [Bacillota bacterium]